MIDIVTARLDAKNDCYVAELPSLQLTDVRIADELVREHERMLTGRLLRRGRRSRTTRIIAQEQGGRPFEHRRRCGRSRCRSRDVLDILAEGASAFTTEEWKRLPAAQRRP